MEVFVLRTETKTLDQTLLLVERGQIPFYAEESYVQE
jgi:hypothetical protein